MRAIVHQNYGSPDVLQLKEVEKPAATMDQVLVKVHATAVTPFDWHALTGTPFIARDHLWAVRAQAQDPRARSGRPCGGGR